MRKDKEPYCLFYEVLRGVEPHKIDHMTNPTLAFVTVVYILRAVMFSTIRSSNGRGELTMTYSGSTRIVVAHTHTHKFALSNYYYLYVYVKRLIRNRCQKKKKRKKVY